MQPLEDRVNPVAYSYHDFQNIFENEDANDSDGSSGIYDFLEPYRQAPFIKKRVVTE